MSGAAPRRAPAAAFAGPLLQVNNLSVTIPSARGDVHAVRDVSFAIQPGERVAVLGESGSGKTMTALTLLGLQTPLARATGQLTFKGQTYDLARQRDAAAAVLADSGVIFQDSLSSLNPIARIGTQLIERLTLRGWKSGPAHAEAVKVLRHVGVADAEARMSAYPHELSGGMRQRVMITMALLAKPTLLVADEPTTALDTTVQAQVIDLIGAVQAETGMSLLLITHDLAMAAEVCDRALIMYAGYVVEDVSMAELLHRPRHPYAEALLGAMPRLDTPGNQKLETIDGEPASALGQFAACPFMPRCRHADTACEAGVPVPHSIAAGHAARCVHHERVGLGQQP